MTLHLSTHFIFLVHGFMGNPDELAYAEESIKRAVIKSNSNNTTNTNNDDSKVNIVTHRVTCNNNKTFDGIEAGGKRVANEVQEFVINHIKANHMIPTGGELKNGELLHASISFVGYSLGGMYSRYAISILPLKFEGIQLHPLSFATAATPHLGMASHSYVILPRFLEYLLGYSFGRTGRDLFRLHRGKKKKGKNTALPPDDVVYKMATESAFLAPLSAFQRRVSYVNAFATDFMVPVATAGILSSYSNSNQYLCSDYDHWNTDEIGFDILAFQTKPSGETNDKELKSSGTRSRKNNETLTMSLSLDSLGWKKVFVDCRSGMSGPSIRCICRHPRKDRLNEAVANKEKTQKGKNSNDETIHFESKELCKLMKSSEYWHLAPTGHFLLVAHSKTKSGARKFAKGRPLVDQASSDLVKYVKDFQLELDTTEKKTTSRENS